MRLTRSKCANADNNARLEKPAEAGRPIYNADNNCGPNLIFMSQSDLHSDSMGPSQRPRAFPEIHCSVAPRSRCSECVVPLYPLYLLIVIINTECRKAILPFQELEPNQTKHKQGIIK